MALRSESKLAPVREAMARGDWDTAIRLAAKFPTLGVHSAAIRRASDALNNPSFYEQLGCNIDTLRHDAIESLKERFSKSWDAAQAQSKYEQQPEEE